MSDSPLRIGTRSSLLARWQADWVTAELQSRGVFCRQVLIETRGDKRRDWSIASLGATGVFTKEIQNALLAGEIDLAVHSLKDLPTEPVPGLTLAAVPPRGPWGDALVASRECTLAELPAGARIGTGSQRRRAQILYHRPDVIVEPLRGNVETRLTRLDEGHFDAVVLAEAGLARLGYANRITQRLTPEYLLPAVGQGALGLETRTGDERTQQAVRLINDVETFAAVTAERALLAGLRGGCLAPVAAWGRMARSHLLLTGRVVSIDGRSQCEVSCLGRRDDPGELGRRVAAILLAQGAAELIRAAREAR